MIFLNYRIKDTRDAVGRLYADLVRTYGEAAVFRDKNGLEGGHNWPDELRRQVAARPIMLVVVGALWGQVKFESGTRMWSPRLSDPEDWVRKEIRAALDELAANPAGRFVIPIRVNGQSLPDREWLAAHGLAELADQQPMPLRDDPEYDRDFAGLTARLEAACPALADARRERTSPTHAAPPAAPLPRRPPVCVGRDDLLDSLRDRFLAPEPVAALPRVAVAGIGGIGKSTAVLWFLHEPAVQTRYGDNRHFVALDGANSHAAVVEHLADNLGLPRGPNLESRLLAALEGGEQRVVVLDNAETPIESDDRLKVQELFAALAAIPHVGLIATLRPEAPLSGWDQLTTVRRLSAADAAAAFHFYSARKFAADAGAAAFVETLEGWPLVVRLAAEHARDHRTIALFRGEWDRRRAELVRQGRDRASNLDVCVKLSLSSPQMTPPGLRLLGVLARLPDGVWFDDLPQLIGDDAAAAESAVRKVGGLVIEEAERLRMLAPMREHLSACLPPADADWTRAVGFYCQVAAEGISSGGKLGVAARLSAQAGNLRSAVLAGLTVGLLDEAVEGIGGLAHHTYVVGGDVTELADRGLLAARKAGNRGREADCEFILADAALKIRADHDQAERLYRSALGTYTALGDRKGQARCLGGLGFHAFRAERYAEARRLTRDARDLFTDIGERRAVAVCDTTLARLAAGVSDYAEAVGFSQQALAEFELLDDNKGRIQCHLGLGHAAAHQSDYATAQRHYLIGESLCRQTGDVYCEYDCAAELGDVALALGEADEAARRYQVAQGIARRLGVPIGEANTALRLGNLHCARRDFAAARAAYQDALRVYQRIQSPLGQGNATQGLANVLLAEGGDLDEAARLYEAAIAFCADVGDREGQGECHRGLGDIAGQQGHPARARRHYLDALRFFAGYHAAQYVGEIQVRLARIAATPTGRAQCVRAAREAWANLPALLAQLDAEFGPDAAGSA